MEEYPKYFRLSFQQKDDLTIYIVHGPDDVVIKVGNEGLLQSICDETVILGLESKGELVRILPQEVVLIYGC